MDLNFLTQDSDLAELKVNIKDNSIFLDTEFVRTNGKEPVLCLMQILSGDYKAIIDTLNIKDFSPIAEILASEKILKVFHACDQDLDVLQAYGICVNNIFDTQIAEMFISAAPSQNYENLVKKYAKVRLSKLYTTSDWQARPLSKGQLKYAINDVIYLPLIYQKQKELLVIFKREAWALDEFRNKTKQYMIVDNLLEQFAPYMDSITEDGLKFLKQMVAWRRENAIKLKVSDNRVIKNDVIISILKYGMLRIKQLKKSRLYKEKLFGEFLKFVEENLEINKTYFLNNEENDEYNQDIVKYLKIALRKISRDNHINPDLIACTKILKEFVKNEGKSDFLSGWRYEMFGKTALKLLKGESVLKIQGNKMEIIDE